MSLDIERWSVSVVAPSMPEFLREQVKPRLELDVTTCCPVCKKESVIDKSVELHRREAEERRNLETLVSWVAEERHCSQCGVASIIPEPQRMKLLRDLDARATSARLLAAVEELGCTPGTTRRRLPDQDGSIAELPAFVVPEESRGREIVLEAA